MVFQCPCPPSLVLNIARFFIHKSIQKLAKAVLKLHARPDEDCMLFPTPTIAGRCKQFVQLKSSATPPPAVRIVNLVPRVGQDACISSGISAVIFPAGEFKLAKQFWQHSGEGISSRRAEFCLQELEDGALVEPSELADRPAKGPKRYSRVPTGKPSAKQSPAVPEGPDASRFVEERFGRNLAVEFVASAKLAVRRRIAGTLKSNVGLKDAIALSSEGGRDVDGFTEEDVYLMPTGMSAIFNAHRVLLETLGPRKSVCYG